MSTNTGTLWIQIHEGEGVPPVRADLWRPWINSPPPGNDLTVRMALHRHIRERGGVPQPFTAHVCYTRDPEEAAKTKSCIYQTYKITKRDEPT